MGVSVVLLAANEADNLKILFPRILENLEKTGTEYEVLLIDSAKATDETPEVCAQFPRVRYINQEEPRYAGAFRTGIRYAGKDRLLVLDADGSHNPDIIPELFRKSMIPAWNVQRQVLLQSVTLLQSQLLQALPTFLPLPVS